MCGIAGFYILDDKNRMPYSKLAELYSSILSHTRERGTDSFGILFLANDNLKCDKRVFNDTRVFSEENIKANMHLIQPYCSIANFRAEPTTERIKNKTALQIQPFSVGGYHVAHNGIIYDDREILENSTVSKFLKDIADYGEEKIIDSYAIIQLAMQHKLFQSSNNLLRSIHGSFALSLVYPNGDMLLARNYRDLAIKIKDGVLFFSSKPKYLDCLSENQFDKAQSIPPYTGVYIIKNEPKRTTRGVSIQNDYSDYRKAAVVLSGGLDSTTAATIACNDCKEVHLLHFKYGCLAQKKEEEAVLNIWKHFSERFPEKKILLQYIDIGFLKELGGSTLIDDTENIKEFDTGVETHSEWVPQRNLVMASLAGAYCDRFKIGRIYLGLNLEEAGAFPDNTTEFYELLERIMDTGSLSRPIIVNPCGNLVKHQIISLALNVKAPIHLSWSCYRDGGFTNDIPELSPGECGMCGPCTMKKIAMKINGLTLGDFV